MKTFFRIDPAVGQLAREDAERRDFLKRLDAAPFEVTDWEAQFIDDHLTSPRPFTPAQRSAIDKMRDSYEGRL